MKKFASILAALVLCLGLTATASAAFPDTADEAREKFTMDLDIDYDAWVEDETELFYRDFETDEVYSDGVIPGYNAIFQDTVFTLTNTSTEDDHYLWVSLSRYPKNSDGLYLQDDVTSQNGSLRVGGFYPGWYGEAEPESVGVHLAAGESFAFTGGDIASEGEIVYMTIFQYYPAWDMNWNFQFIFNVDDTLAAQVRAENPEEPELPEYATSGTCGIDGDNLAWAFDENSGVLTVSGEGEMYDQWEDLDVEGPELPPWASLRMQIKEIVVEEGVTSIGAYAFTDCYALTKIDLPESLTVIGKNAFAWAGMLEEVSIPDGVEIMGENTFTGCSELKKVKLPASLKVLDMVFPMCNALEELEIPEGVTTIGNNVFDFCFSLREITIPASVTSIGAAAFVDCFLLENVHYGGSEADWRNISVGGDNDNLLNAKIHFTEVPDTTVSGTVSGGEGATIEIMVNGESVQVEVQEDGSFALPAEGEFDVVIKKPGCLTVTVKNVSTENGDVALPEVVMVAGDVNGDDKINISDMGAFRQEFGKVGGNIANGLTDVNGDGKVNIADMGIFRQNFGKTAEKDCTIEF